MKGGLGDLRSSLSGVQGKAPLVVYGEGDEFHENGDMRQKPQKPNCFDYLIANVASNFAHIVF